MLKRITLLTVFSLTFAQDDDTTPQVDIHSELRELRQKFEEFGEELKKIETKVEKEFKETFEGSEAQAKSESKDSDLSEDMQKEEQEESSLDFQPQMSTSASENEADVYLEGSEYGDFKVLG